MRKNSKKQVRNKKSKKITRSEQEISIINPNAAGIDVGADEVFVAIPKNRDGKTIKSFGTTTPELREMADWLKQCGVTTAAMESTGVYWIPVFTVLEEKELEPHLVDARQVRNVPGRKTDVSDAQWIQQLHSYGLLAKAVVLPEDNRRLQALLRHRESLVRTAGREVQHMQKAMTQMNIRLDRVVTDITGKTGLSIIRAISNGQHEPKQLAQFREKNCKHTEKEFVNALTGKYTEEQLFTLHQSLDLFDFTQGQLATCETKIQNLIKSMKPKDGCKIDDSFAQFSPTAESQTNDLSTILHRLWGVDLEKMPGIGIQTILTLVAEIGTDLSRWPSSKHFASWLGLCPQNRISGGKILKSRTKPSANRAAAALRMAVNSLYRSDNYLASFLARMKMRKDKAKAITAAAHKLACIIYECVTNGKEYNEQGSEKFNKQQRSRKLRKIKQLMKELDLEESYPSILAQT